MQCPNFATCFYSTNTCNCSVAFIQTLGEKACNFTTGDPRPIFPKVAQKKTLAGDHYLFSQVPQPTCFSRQAGTLSANLLCLIVGCFETSIFGQICHFGRLINGSYSLTLMVGVISLLILDDCWDGILYLEGPL